MTVAVGANLAFIESEFEGPVSELSGTVTVTDVPIRIVPDDPEGLALTMINLGTESVFVLPNNTVTANFGILMVAGGGSLSMNVRDDQSLPARSWWGITASGSTSITWLRTRRYALGATEM